MPKHDFTPAMSPDKLEGYITFLKDKINKCEDDKGETYKELYRIALIEYLVSLTLERLKP